MKILNIGFCHYDRAIGANAFNLGDPVWVLCRYVSQKSLPKFMKACRGLHKTVHVLQEGGICILDSGKSPL